MQGEEIEDRPKHDSPAIVGKQLEHLVSGGYKDREQTIIDDKLPKIPYRIQYLIEDLALLHTADFIEADHWEQIWRQICEMATRNPVYDGKITGYEGEQPDAYELGIQLGHLAYLLMKEGGHEPSRIEMAAGFQLGLMGEFMAPLDSLGESPEDSEEDITQESVLFSESRHRDALHHHLEQAQEVIWESLQSLTDPQPVWAKSALENAGLPGIPPLTDVLYETEIPNHHDFDPPKTSKIFDQWGWKFKREYQEQLDQAEKLANHIEWEIDALPKKEWRGASGIEVLYGYSLDKKEQDAIEEHRRTSVPKQSIKKVGNDLKGTGTSPWHWEDYPLLRENDQPNAFGKLLSAILFPDSKYRDNNKYLPTKTEDETQFYVDPSRKEILTACYAYALGTPSEERKASFQEAYQERIKT